MRGSAAAFGRALCPGRAIERLYRQHCLQRGQEQPPEEAGVEDELMVLEGSSMWQKVCGCGVWVGGIPHNQGWEWLF